MDPKGYRGIIRGLYRAPLKDYIGVILRNTQVGAGSKGLGFRASRGSTGEIP